MLGGFKWVTVSCGRTHRTEDVPGIERRCRTCAHCGNREPCKQMNGPAPCYRRTNLESSVCQGETEQAWWGQSRCRVFWQFETLRQLMRRICRLPVTALSLVLGIRLRA